MKAVDELRGLYQERRPAIQARLGEFKQVLQRSEEEIFAELCFCLLTPQSSAKTCWDAVTRLKEKGLLLRGSPQELEPILNNVRFNDSKAKYIVQARTMFSKDGDLRVKPHITSYYNPYELREWL
ncbi:MAG: DNA lyase, partial [Thermoproteota archaeon]